MLVSTVGNVAAILSPVPGYRYKPRRYRLREAFANIPLKWHGRVGGSGDWVEWAAQCILLRTMLPST